MAVDPSSTLRRRTNRTNMRDEFIVQLIDEFQFSNSEICWDRVKKNLAADFTAGCHRTAEYRNAPLPVSGSRVGWLMRVLVTKHPGRFSMNVFENIPRNEIIEIIFNYSRRRGAPVTSGFVIRDFAWDGGKLPGDLPDMLLTCSDEFSPPFHSEDGTGGDPLLTPWPKFLTKRNGKTIIYRLFKDMVFFHRKVLCVRI